MEEPETMENELKERLKTTHNRAEIALILLELGKEHLVPTMLEDLAYGCQIIIDRFCIK